jgi:hypothetical protein
MFNIFKRKPVQLNTFALNIATIVTTEIAFEKLAKENPQLFKELHFKLIGKKTGENFEADIASSMREWELGKVEIISQYIGERRMNELRNKLALTITNFLDE